LLTAAAAQTSPCVDLDEHCASWADAGEILRNPGYMFENCCESCSRHVAAPQIPWQAEDLSTPVVGSAIAELTPESLHQLGSRSKLLIVWFYVPWCKQCKLVRPALEQAAQRLAGQVEFGRIDCVAHPEVKLAHGIFSCAPPAARPRYDLRTTLSFASARHRAPVSQVPGVQGVPRWTVHVGRDAKGAFAQPWPHIEQLASQHHP